MTSRVQKWGNSLALRIPKSFAAEVGLSENLPVELSVKGGKLVVEPQAEKPLRLDELLQGVTKSNLHDVWEAGQSVGREAL